MNDVDSTDELVDRFYKWKRLARYLAPKKILAFAIICFLASFYITYYLLAEVDRGTIIFAIVLGCVLETISLVSSIEIKPQFFFGISAFLGIIVGGILRC